MLIITNIHNNEVQIGLETLLRISIQMYNILMMRRTNFNKLFKEVYLMSIRKTILMNTKSPTHQVLVGFQF